MDAVDKSPQFYPVEWKDVKDRVSELQPRLAVAIDRLISEEKELPLYYARYSYGSLIVDESGVFNFPLDGKLIPITSQDCPKDLRAAFDYDANAMPLSLVLSGSLDLFMSERPDQIETFANYDAGTVLALRRLLDPNPELSFHTRKTWRISSGARTPIMIPSISNRTQFDKLRRKYGLTTHKPNSQSEHWAFFRDLANSADFPTPWFTEMLLFPKPWLPKNDTVAWQLFHHELLSIAWKATAFARNLKFIDRVWSNFINSLRNKRATPYVLAVLKHIIEVSLGEMPAYRVVNENNPRGPFPTIAELVVKDYGLKDALPLIVEPSFFSKDTEELFVSLKFLTQPWTLEAPIENLSLMSHLREVQYLLTQFLDYLHPNHAETADTPFASLNDLEYDFYHYSDDPHEEIHPSHQAFLDNAAANQLIRRYGKQDMPRSPKNEFLSGLVKIKKKNYT